ncbi:TetR family transcriptional regulator [Actinoplanes sp. ATCC 53533]|uniref:TetR/AcrR family transcriptional regulator n=1 Tax=Actinoplanes sp. ATCC 53533 TaxID=1288362 RepID=UPI000F792C06|nr:TetR/AcrR family transcriptional regulator [Actinoplanes sp. ATCC 53533]RSM59771.1 TetR family transcriptional regulator [Actinoplanes sp. ATCC 53533]
MASTNARPLRRDAERNRQRILQAAQEVFAERGLDVSLDDIAAHAGLGVGTVYRRFASKEDLVESLFTERLRGVVTAAQQALTDPDAWRGLIGFLDNATAQQAVDRGLREVILGSRFGQDHVASFRDALQPIITELVARAQAQGRLRADVAETDIPLIAIMLGGVVDYTRHVEPDIWRRCLSLVIDGLRAGGSTPLRPDPLTPDQVDQAMRSWHPSHR